MPKIKEDIMSRDQRKLRNLVKVGILSAMSFILMFIQFPIPIAPPFMKVDLADVPALIGGFSMGPIYGVLVQLIKNLLNLTKTSTGGVGEISNFIVGGLFVFISASIYQRKKTKRTATIALIAGMLIMTLTATISNAFVIFPLYGKIMGIGMDTFVQMTQKVNGLVNSYFTLMIFAIVPFNLVKAIIEIFVTKLLYKRVSRILHEK